MKTRFPPLPSPIKDLFTLSDMVKVKDKDLQNWIDRTKKLVGEFQKEADRVSKSQDVDKLYAEAEKALEDAKYDAETLLTSAQKEIDQKQADFDRAKADFQAVKEKWEDDAREKHQDVLRRETAAVARMADLDAREKTLREEEQRLSDLNTKLLAKEKVLNDKTDAFEQAKALLA